MSEKIFLRTSERVRDFKGGANEEKNIRRIDFFLKKLFLIPLPINAKVILIGFKRIVQVTVVILVGTSIKIVVPNFLILKIVFWSEGSVFRTGKGIVIVGIEVTDIFLGVSAIS